MYKLNVGFYYHILTILLANVKKNSQNAKKEKILNKK